MSYFEIITGLRSFSPIGAPELPNKDAPIPGSKIEVLQENLLNKTDDKFSSSSQTKLSLKQQSEVIQLQQLDRSVREHERSHLRTAGDLAVGGMDFEYKMGPDGKKYAVGGEVNIDSNISFEDPDKAIEKAARIYSTATAPADPSPKDMRAAVQARIMESKAHRVKNRDEFFDVIMSNKSKDFLNPENAQNLEKEYNVMPGAKAYQSSIDNQKELYQILDLFT